MPAQFVCDSSLEFIARRLRFLGYDVAPLGTARLEELFEIARRDTRTVLTRSSRRPARWADVPARSLDPLQPAAAIRAIAESDEPAGPPFSRCPGCNVVLERRTPFEAHGEVPGRVLRRMSHVHYCPHCGKWYWDGTHTARIRAWLEQALGRPLAGAPPAG